MMLSFLSAHLPPIQVLQIVIFGPSIAIALAGILGIVIVIFRPIRD